MPNDNEVKHLRIRDIDHRLIVPTACSKRRGYEAVYTTTTSSIERSYVMPTVHTGVFLAHEHLNHQLESCA